MVPPHDRYRMTAVGFALPAKVEVVCSSCVGSTDPSLRSSCRVGQPRRWHG
jgi:hypothetical protein